MMQRQKFRDFIWRILKASKLRIELGAIQKAFLAELTQNKEEVQNYFRNMADIWDSWKEINNVDFISQFFMDLGRSLLIMWMSEVFPFNFDQLIARCQKAPSLEEALLEIDYDFDHEELMIIKDALIGHWIDESVEQVAQTMFIEAIKSISGVFSKIIKHPFKIFTSKVDLIRANDTLKIRYFGAGRVEK
ncbi:MAG: hypothetical protein ACTSQI_19230 [Candidatus Helarchaeota archaeon]